MKPSPANNNIARTKIVATLGPASKSAEAIRELIIAGVDVFRLNMAHGTIEEKEEIFRTVRAASDELNTNVAILVDLAGPKIRLGQLPGDAITLTGGQNVSMVRGEVSEKSDELVCLYPQLIDEVAAGDMIILADGVARLEVIEKQPDRLVCEVNDGGVVRTRQGVSLPGTNLSIPALGEKDIRHARWATKMEADFVSLSFVRNAGEIESLKIILAEKNSTANVVAKIEKPEALDNLESIVKASDGIMVARGDLGVEIDIARTPLVQKQIISMCRKHRRPVIVATQMLESMHENKQPTRAEVTDVANALLDGADACMLSGETAVGQYPVESVKMMNRIMVQTENGLGVGKRKIKWIKINDRENSSTAVTDVLTVAAAKIASRINAGLVAIASSSPNAALAKSGTRDYQLTVCITDSPVLARQMNLMWGIIPLVSPALEPETLRKLISKWGSEALGLESGREIVIVSDTNMIPGVHDCITVSKIE